MSDKVLIEAVLTDSSIMAFKEALNGQKGDLDAWLECNDEAEVRAHINALLTAQPQASAAQSAALVQMPDVDDLANFIRFTDGNHKMGAGALAERIVDWLSAPSAAQSAPAGEREDCSECNGLGFGPFDVCGECGGSGQAIAAWQRTQSAGVPEGWRLVPAVATLHMKNAGWQEIDRQGVDPESCEMQTIYHAMLATAPAQPAAQEAPTPETVWMRLLDVMRRDNGVHFYASTKDFAEAHDAIVELVAAGFFIEWRNELDDDYWTAAAGEQSEAAARFPAESYERLSDALNRVFERADEPTEPAAQDQGEVQRLREALENSRRAMFAVLKQETRLKAVAKRVLAAEIERIDALAASTGQEV